MEDCLNDLARRDFITMMALGGLGAAGAGLLAGAGSQNALASSTAESDHGLYNSNDEYVYLSIVTQVPFWSDAKQALSDFSRVTRVKTRFLGPPTFDVAGQAT